MSKSESSQSDKQRLAAELADEIEPQIGAITHVSLSRAERELVVEALRALSAPSAGLSMKPRSAYEPLTEEVIERMRAAGKAGYLDAGNRAWDTLCDMAISALQYAEEIRSLRDTPQSATGERLAVAERLLRKAMPRLSRTYEACQYDADYMAIKDFLDATVGPTAKDAE